ncbi:alpha/beta hydrolase family protein [Pontibacter arcticus]|uniref:Alpha/beta hydrolase n=1 Tax=Pontibacter arcticus TaxID=2080288 RepID=A0A364RD36_9BACT|nr:alpha/beta fold hydrolase [Pontibacter arcticus]RAU82202.1 alpha/beta hydrolase [Pontibacter arcticus]
MKKHFLYFLLLLYTSSALAQPAAQVTGFWNGAIQTGGMQLALVFHIQESNGALTATMDVPAQSAKGIPVKEVKLVQDSLFLHLPAIGGSYAGKLTAPGTIEGTWKQSGQTFAMQLKKGEAVQPKRPQEPVKPYPYKEQEVSITNSTAGIKLAGTFTLPTGKGPFPAVILISGSGAQDRDGTVMDHKPYLVLADHLTRQGLAVLRLDDRGVGGSTGNPASATTLDFATDITAAYTFLKAQPSINQKKIGLVGHSEGALIAAKVANQQPDVAYVVLLAGNAVPGTELLVAQNEALLTAAGMPETLLKPYLELRKKQFEVAATQTDAFAAAKKIRKLEQETTANLTAEQKTQLGFTAQSEQAIVAQLSSPWVKHFLAYDPVLTLQKLKQPVLVLNGTNDLQVPASQNLPAAEKALKAAGNKTYTIKEMPALNHLFQTAKTGLPNEYSQLEETFAPLALQTISDWIKSTLKK